MPRVPSLSPRRVERILLAEGFLLLSQKGSHFAFGKGERIVTVPMHARDLARGTLLAIIKQSGIPRARFFQGARGRRTDTQPNL